MTNVTTNLRRSSAAYFPLHAARLSAQPVQLAQLLIDARGYAGWALRVFDHPEPLSYARR
ncbi:MAG: hypothetical protein JOZ19_08285 [Rubrobacter sp.]|nr:hypothetical protein [Rubrobacter sp.]